MHRTFTKLFPWKIKEDNFIKELKENNFKKELKENNLKNDLKEHKNDLAKLVKPFNELQTQVRNYLESTFFHYADNGTPFFLNANTYSHHRVCKEILSHKDMDAIIHSLDLYLRSNIQLNKEDSFYLLLQQFFSRYEHYYIRLSIESRTKLSITNQFITSINEAKYEKIFAELTEHSPKDGRFKMYFDIIGRNIVSLPQRYRSQFFELIKDYTLQTKTMHALWPVMDPEYKILFLKKHLQDLEKTYKRYGGMSWEYSELEYFCLELTEEDVEAANLIINFALNTATWDKYSHPYPDKLISFLSALIRFINKRSDCDDIIKLMLEKFLRTEQPLYLLLPFFSKMNLELKDRIIESWMDPSENKSKNINSHDVIRAISSIPLDKQSEYIEKIIAKSDNLILVIQILPHLKEPLYLKTKTRIVNILKDFGDVTDKSKANIANILNNFLPLIEDENCYSLILKNLIPKLFNSDLLQCHYSEYFDSLKELVPLLKLEMFKELREKLIREFMELFQKHATSSKPDEILFSTNWGLILLSPLVSDAEKKQMFTILYQKIFEYTHTFYSTCYEATLLNNVAYTANLADLNDLIDRFIKGIRRWKYEYERLNSKDLLISIMQSLIKNHSQICKDSKTDGEKIDPIPIINKIINAFKDELIQAQNDLSKNYHNDVWYRNEIYDLFCKFNEFLNSTSLSSQICFEIAVPLVELLNHDYIRLDIADILCKLFKEINPDQQVELMDAVVKMKDKGDLCLARMQHIYQTNIQLMNNFKPMNAIIMSYVSHRNN